MVVVEFSFDLPFICNFISYALFEAATAFLRSA